MARPACVGRTQVAKWAARRAAGALAQLLQRRPVQGPHGAVVAHKVREEEALQIPFFLPDFLQTKSDPGVQGKSRHISTARPGLSCASRKLHDEHLAPDEHGIDGERS